MTACCRRTISPETISRNGSTIHSSRKSPCATWRRTHRASRTRSWQSMIQHTVPTTWSCLGGKASSGGVPATSTPSTVKPIPLRWRGTRRPSFPPGSAAHYSNPGTAMLSYCIMVALQGTPTADVRTLLHQRVHAPLGLRENEDYSIGYERTWDVDGLPLVANWGGGGFTPRATARVGQLLAQDGAWEGRTGLSPNSGIPPSSTSAAPMPRRATTTSISPHTTTAALKRRPIRQRFRPL